MAAFDSAFIPVEEPVLAGAEKAEDRPATVPPNLEVREPTLDAWEMSDSCEIKWLLKN